MWHLSGHRRFPLAIACSETFAVEIRTTMFELPYSEDFIITLTTTLESIRSQKGVVQRDMGNGYCWYHLPIKVVAGEEAGFSLCFKRGNLFSVKLALMNFDRYGSSWATFSEDQETRRAHDTIEWMSGLGLDLGDYDWGSISGGYDPKSASGGAYIQIKTNGGQDAPSSGDNER